MTSTKKTQRRKFDVWEQECLNYCSLTKDVTSKHVNTHRERYNNAIYYLRSNECYFLKENIFRSKCNVPFFKTLEKIIERVDPAVKATLDRLISKLPVATSEQKPASAYDIFIIPADPGQSLRNLKMYRGTLYTDEEIRNKSIDARKDYDYGFDEWIGYVRGNNIRENHFTKYKQYYVAAVTNPESREGAELRAVNKDALIQKMMDRDVHMIEYLKVVLRHHNLTKLQPQLDIFLQENGRLDRDALAAFIENKRAPDPKPEPKQKQAPKQKPEQSSSEQHFQNVMMSNKSIDSETFKRSLLYVADVLLIGADPVVKNEFVECMVTKHNQTKNISNKCFCFHPDQIERHVLSKLELSTEEIQRHKDMFASASSVLLAERNKAGGGRKKSARRIKLSPYNTWSAKFKKFRYAHLFVFLFSPINFVIILYLFNFCLRKKLILRIAELSFILFQTVAKKHLLFLLIVLRSIM